MSFVDLNRNPFTIIGDTNLFPAYVNVDFLHFFIPLEVVSCVN